MNSYKRIGILYNYNLQVQSKEKKIQAINYCYHLRRMSVYLPVDKLFFY